MKKIYVEPSIKVLRITGCSLLETSPGHNATWGPDNEASKRFTGGIEFDDEDTSSSPWDD